MAARLWDYTAEPGYYKVDNSALPSFNGQFKDTLKESLSRVKFGGQTPTKQQVFFLNLQEIKGIKFGTRNPINYFDSFYNAELFLRAHGSYSIKITDPLRFYQEVIPRNKERVNIEDINEQYISEFLEAFQAAVNQMSAEGIRSPSFPPRAWSFPVICRISWMRTGSSFGVWRFWQWVWPAFPMMRNPRS